MGFEDRMVNFIAS